MSIFIGEGGREVLKKVKAYVAIVMLMFGVAGLNIISAATLRNDIDQNVLIVYRNIAAAVFITPFTLWLERKRKPKITPLVMLKIFGLAVLDPLLQQHMYYTGVKWTSASFASEVENMIPAATFFMSILLRTEKLEIKLKSGQAKVIGILVTVAGAAVMILCKGPTLEFMQYLKGRHPHHSNTTASTSHSEDSFMWMKGAFMLIGSITSWAAFLNLQSYTLDTYPAELTISSLVCSMGAAINAVVAFVLGRGITKKWILRWDLTLLTVVYSGVICTGVAYYVLGMVSRERGPVFSGAFAPLAMIMTIVMGSVFLSEEITLGRTIGAAIIVIGLYCLLWGKSKDYQTDRHEAERNERKPEPVIASSNSIQQVSIDCPQSI